MKYYKDFFVVIVLFLGLIFSQNNFASTFLHVDATASNYVGNGQDQIFDQVTVDVQNFVPQGKRVTIDAGGLNLRLGAVSGEVLVPDNYEFAQSNTDANLAFPYLDISSPGRGCNYSIGRLVIHELEIDAFDIVNRLAIDFESTCYGVTPQFLYGEVRYNSNLPAILQRPHAAAGRDQIVGEGVAVYLDGRNSYRGTTNITGFQWRQLSGPTVQLAESNTPTPSFVAPEVVTGGSQIEVQLAVTNEAGLTHTDTVNIRVQDILDPHTFFYLNYSDSYLPLNNDYFYPENFGVYQVTSSLQGFSAFYRGLDSYSFMFSSAGSLSEGYYIDLYESFGSLKPTFSFDSICGGLPRFKPARIFIHEIGYDTDGNIDRLAADFIEYCPGINRGIIRINSSYPMYRSEPYAVAGMDKSVYESSTVILNGSYSDSGSDLIKGNIDRIVSYKWEQVSGTAVTMTDANMPVAYFEAPAISTEEILVFDLTVTDSEGLSNTDQVEITIKPTDITRSFAMMTGSNYVLRAGMVLDETNTVFEFTENPSRLIIQYLDESRWTSTFRTLDYSPLAIGSYTTSAINDDLVTFSGDGRGCNYDSGNYTIFSLSRNSSNIIDDLSIDFEHFCENYNASITGKIRINQVVDGTVPTANAGLDVNVNEGSTYTLDATGSVDTDGEIVAYRWRQLTGRTDTLHHVGKNTTPMVELVAKPLALGVNSEELIFELTVYDDDGFSSQDIVKVTVVRSNVAPVAVDDVVTIGKNTAVDINVKANDSDIDGMLDSLLFITEPAFGEKKFNAPSTVRYIPGQDFVGTDTFEYAVLDDTGAYSNTAKVTIIVTESASLNSDNDTGLNSDNDTSLDESSVDGDGGGGGTLSPLLLLVLPLLIHGLRQGRGIGKRYKLAFTR